MEPIKSFWRKLSTFLQEKTRRLTPKALKIYLALFVLIGGGVSTWTCLNAIRGVRVSKALPAFRERISTGRQAIQRDENIEAIRSSWDLIISFDRRMDSLKASQNGRAAYDSLLRARPGLFDSLRKAEMIYHEEIDSAGE
jgi:hypothetical protein